MGLFTKIDEEGLLKAIDKKMDDVATSIFNESQRNIIDKEIIDEGTLLKSGNINREFLRKSIIYPVSYADCIEFGRLPGTMPPSGPIKAWVKRKGLASDDKQAARIAWAIMMDIKKNGQMPRPYLSPAVESHINQLRRIK